MPELLQNTAPGGVRERGKRGIEARPRILNHVVQYNIRIGDMKGEASARLGFTDDFRVELAWAKFLGAVLSLAPVPTRLPILSASW